MCMGYCSVIIVITSLTLSVLLLLFSGARALVGAGSVCTEAWMRSAWRAAVVHGRCRLLRMLTVLLSSTRAV